MNFVVLHMDYPSVVHVVDSLFQVVDPLVDTLEQFLQLLPTLVVDVREVEALEERLEPISNNR